MVGDLIFEGAEARVSADEFLGLPSVRKERARKLYRHPELDQAIRRARQRDEALILREAGAAGVPVPRVLDVDLATGTTQLERIQGPTLREHLEQVGAAGAPACDAFGRVLARLHRAGIVHGDPTTSNVLVGSRGPVLVDFGLAQRSRELEDRGVDLVLAERTFEATHPGRTDLWLAFVRGYGADWDEAAHVLERAREVRARGRYV